MSPFDQNHFDFDTDVLVIGGGGSGMPAAAAACEAGAKVIVIDKRKVLGGTARMAQGMFAVESPTQKRLGIHHTADECFTDHMERTNWTCDARLVRHWINESGEIVHWLEEKGINFDNVLSFTGTKRFYHQVTSRSSMTGNTIIDVLSAFCKAQGVEFLMETRARKLLVNKKGRITGIIADQNGTEIKIGAKCIVIATGSISGNQPLLERYFPGVSFKNVKIMAALPFCTGDGLEMALSAGAASGRFSTLFIGPHNHPYNTYVGCIIRRPHMVYVNKYGIRYANEGLFYLHDYGWLCGMALDRQPDRMCYVLADDRIIKYMIKNKRNYAGIEASVGRSGSGDALANIDKGTSVAVVHESSLAWLDELEKGIEAEVKAGRIKKSNSWDEIAEWMGADATVLNSTVDQYNTFCRNSYDADFLKNKDYLLPLSNPPYYAILAHQGIDTVIGGIVINHRMEVLDKHFIPIGGLYASGVATSGWLGEGYGFSGSELGFSIFSGYTAGRNAVKYIRFKNNKN